MNIDKFTKNTVYDSFLDYKHDRLICNETRNYDYCCTLCDFKEIIADFVKQHEKESKIMDDYCFKKGQFHTKHDWSDVKQGHYNE